RLDPQQVGRLGERGANSSLIRKVDELDLSFATTTPRIEQPVSSTVAIVGSNDPSIAGNQVSHQRDSCHARCGHNTTRTQFQLGNSRSEQIPRRISGACVVVAPLFPKTAERKRRGEVNGGYDGARGVVRLEPSSYGLGNLAETVAHDRPSRATEKIRRNCSVSFRKASWP